MATAQTKFMNEPGWASNQDIADGKGFEYENTAILVIVVVGAIVIVGIILAILYGLGVVEEEEAGEETTNTGGGEEAGEETTNTGGGEEAGEETTNTGGGGGVEDTPEDEPSLVLRYALDGSTTALTNTGNNADDKGATVTGTTTYDSTEDAYKFTGGTSYLNKNSTVMADGSSYLWNSTLEDLREAYTISFWAKATDWTNLATTTQRTFSVGNSAVDQAVGLLLLASNSTTSATLTMHSMWYGDDIQCPLTTTLSELNTSNEGWHLWTVAFDTDMNTITFFMDGVQKCALSKTNEPAFAATSSDAKLRIGGTVNESTTAWNGWMRDVRVYNVALTAAEVLELYTGGFDFALLR